MRCRNWYNHHRYRLKRGIPEIEVSDHLLPELAESEWSPTFEKLMRNRLIIGALRYGRIHTPGKPVYDRIGSILKRLRIYKQTGNTEFLVDVANLALLEFEEGIHPEKHFSSIDDGEHVSVIGK